MRYKVVPKDADVDVETALVQSVFALDAAAVKAEMLNDVEGLLNVAAMWMKLSETISGLVVEATEEKVVKSESRIEIGFQGMRPDPERIDAEEIELDV